MLNIFQAATRFDNADFLMQINYFESEIKTVKPLWKIGLRTSS